MRRWWIWGAGAVALVIVAAVVASFFVDEPLRRYLERQLNARLQGYTVRIGALDFHPFGFSTFHRISW
jgi:peptidoglycan/LPS O-acetylase OafA/YrhL